MAKQKPLADAQYQLERFPGKGGWTYARIPEILQDKSKPFGWMKVKGTVDGYETGKTHLMPMGNGQLFLPVRSDIRKKIGKSAGAMVHVVLYPDNDPLEIPSEMLDCLKDEPRAFKFFHSLSGGEQNYYIKWVYSAKREETRVTRLVKTIDRLARREKFYDQD
jgi:hypothetical protein